MEDVLFEFYKGRTYTRDFEISGWSREIDQMYFTLKSAVDDKIYELQKTLGNGITLIEKGTNEAGEPYHLFNLNIDATDTDELQINKNYIFDIAIISGNIKETAMTGTLRLKGTATATNNEKEV